MKCIRVLGDSFEDYSYSELMSALYKILIWLLIWIRIFFCQSVCPTGMSSFDILSYAMNINLYST
jgi:hypothetical protein